MGDRFDKSRRGGSDARLIRHRGKPPPTLLAWGLGTTAAIGHNNGPPIEDEQPGYLFRRYRWTKAHAAAWKTPAMSVLKFRMARAEAAGLSYRDYMLTLLDTGRHAQARDRVAARLAALSTIRTVWADVLPKLCPEAPRMAAVIVLASLIAAYDDEARAYHNAVHVAAVLDDVARHATTAHDIDLVRMAALFHDVVYDPRRTDNEAESARVARLHLTDLGATPAALDRIEHLILATRHRPEDVAAAVTDSDAALLLDCDLATLAAPAERYLAYAAAIRREYAHVPDADFRAGRARVLAAFLARPTLYASAQLAELWEARARTNLEAERAALMR